MADSKSTTGSPVDPRLGSKRDTSGVSSSAANKAQGGITFEAVTSNKSGTRSLKAATSVAKKEPIDTTTVLLLVCAISAIGLGFLWTMWPSSAAPAAENAMPKAAFGRPLADSTNMLPTFEDVTAYRFSDSPRDLVQILQLGMKTVGRPHGIVIGNDPPFWHQRVLRLDEKITVSMTQDGKKTDVELTLIYFDDGVAIFRDSDGKWHRLLSPQWWDEVSKKYGWRGDVRQDELEVTRLSVDAVLYDYKFEGVMRADLPPDTQRKLATVADKYLDAIREKLRTKPDYEQTPAEQKEFFRKHGFNIEPSDEPAAIE